MTSSKLAQKNFLIEAFQSNCTAPTLILPLMDLLRECGDQEMYKVTNEHNENKYVFDPKSPLAINHYIKIYLEMDEEGGPLVLVNDDLFEERAGIMKIILGLITEENWEASAKFFAMGK